MQKIESEKFFFQDMREYTGIGILFDEFLRYCVESKEEHLSTKDISHLTEFFPKAKHIYHPNDTRLSHIGDYKPQKHINDDDFWVNIQYTKYEIPKNEPMHCSHCGSTRSGHIFIPEMSDTKRPKTTAYSLWSATDRNNIINLLTNDESSRVFKCSKSGTIITIKEEDFKKGYPYFTAIVKKLASIWQYELSEEEKLLYEEKADQYDKEITPIESKGMMWNIIRINSCVLCFYGWREIQLKEFPTEKDSENDKDISFMAIRNQLIKDKGYYIYMMLCYSIIENIIPKELIVEFVHLRMQLLLKDFDC